MSFTEGDVSLEHALSFNSPIYMQYHEPEQELNEGVTRYQVIRSQSGNSTFRQNETIRVHISEKDAFLRPDKCFLTFKLQFTKGGSAMNTTDSAFSMPWVGAGSAFFRIRSTVNGSEIEDISHYPALLGCAYSKMPQEGLNTLKVLEGTGSQTNHGSNYFTTGQYLSHVPRTALFESSKLLPIPFMRGLDLEFYTGPVNQLIASAGANLPDNYTINDFAFHAAWTHVDSAYLNKFWTGVMEHGRSAYIPIKLTKCIPSSIPNNTTNLTQIFPVGQVDSLASATFVIRDGSVFQTPTTSGVYNIGTSNTVVNGLTLSNMYNTQTMSTVLDSDQSYNANSSRISEWWITAESHRYPADLSVGGPVGFDQSNQLLRLSNLAYTLGSVDMNFAGLNTLLASSPVVQNDGVGKTTSTQYDQDQYRSGFLHWTWEPTALSFGKGLRMNDSQLQLFSNFISPYNNNTRCDGYFVMDGIVEVSKDGTSVKLNNWRKND